MIDPSTFDPRPDEDALVCVSHGECVETGSTSFLGESQNQEIPCYAEMSAEKTNVTARQSEIPCYAESSTEPTAAEFPTESEVAAEPTAPPVPETTKSYAEIMAESRGEVYRGGKIATANTQQPSEQKDDFHRQDNPALLEDNNSVSSLPTTVSAPASLAPRHTKRTALLAARKEAARVAATKKAAAKGTKPRQPRRRAEPILNPTAEQIQNFVLPRAYRTREKRQCRLQADALVQDSTMRFETHERMENAATHAMKGAETEAEARLEQERLMQARIMEQQAYLAQQQQHLQQQLVKLRAGKGVTTGVTQKAKVASASGDNTALVAASGGCASGGSSGRSTPRGAKSRANSEPVASAHFTPSILMQDESKNLMSWVPRRPEEKLTAAALLPKDNPRAQLGSRARKGGGRTLEILGGSKKGGGKKGVKKGGNKNPVLASLIDDESSADEGNATPPFECDDSDDDVSHAVFPRSSSAPSVAAPSSGKPRGRPRKTPLGGAVFLPAAVVPPTTEPSARPMIVSNRPTPFVIPVQKSNDKETAHKKKGVALGAKRAPYNTKKKAAAVSFGGVSVFGEAPNGYDSASHMNYAAPGGGLSEGGCGLEPEAAPLHSDGGACGLEADGGWE